MMVDDDLYRCSIDDSGIVSSHRLFNRSFVGCRKLEVW